MRVVNSGTSAINVTFDFLSGDSTGVTTSTPSSYTVSTLASSTGGLGGPGTRMLNTGGVRE